MNEPKAFQEAAYLAAQEFAELVIKKQMDYGPRNIMDFGEYGILVRLNDKLQRLINLFKKDQEPENETVDDTWDDIGGYAFVRKMVRKGWFELPMEIVEIVRLTEKGREYLRDEEECVKIRCPECGEFVAPEQDVHDVLDGLGRHMAYVDHSRCPKCGHRWGGWVRSPVLDPLDPEDAMYG